MERKDTACQIREQKAQAAKHDVENILRTLGSSGKNLSDIRIIPSEISLPMSVVRV